MCRRRYLGGIVAGIVVGIVAIIILAIMLGDAEVGAHVHAVPWPAPAFVGP